MNFSATLQHTVARTSTLVLIYSCTLWLQDTDKRNNNWYPCHFFKALSQLSHQYFDKWWEQMYCWPWPKKMATLKHCLFVLTFVTFKSTWSSKVTKSTWKLIYSTGLLHPSILCVSAVWRELITNKHLKGREHIQIQDGETIPVYRRKT